MPGNPFTLGRDYSTNQVPVVGRQPIDAQDVVVWATRLITEVLNSDANGVVTTSQPMIDLTHDFAVDSGGINRERRVDGSDVQAVTSPAGVTLFPGVATGLRQIPIYRDNAFATAAASQAISVTYRTAIPLNADNSGNLIAGTGQISGTVDISDRPARQLGVLQRGLADTVAVANYVLAPGAGATIAATQQVPAGVYRVYVQTLLSGGGTADVVNMKLRHGVTDVGNLVAPLTNEAINAAFDHVTLQAAEIISVLTSGAGNAGTVYAAAIQATRVA